MKHFVYLKIKGGEYDQSLKVRMEQIMNDLLRSVCGFQAYRILQAKRETSETYPVLIELTFADQQAKGYYLAHPLHLELLRQIKPVLVDKAAFDA